MSLPWVPLLAACAWFWNVAFLVCWWAAVA